MRFFMQVVYDEKNRVYLRINPDDDREIQWASKLYQGGTTWQRAKTFSSSIIALDLDDDDRCAVAVLENHKTYVATSGGHAWNYKFYPPSSRIHKMYG
jgi:hypothetical protein